MAPCFVPTDALAASSNDAVVTVDDGGVTWDSTTASNPNITNSSNTSKTIGVYAGGTSQDSIIITLQSGHKITISSPGSNTSATTLYGIYAERSNENKINNGGDITITAQSTSGTAKAYGMYAENSGTDDSNILINKEDGTITVTATSDSGIAYARGMYASGSSTTNTLTNSGKITVTAESTSGTANAQGMYVSGSGTSTLNNYGIINVSATSTSGTAASYQAYVNSGTANIGTWNMLLGETYRTQENGSTYYVFGVNSSGATLNFGPDSNTGASFTFYGIGDDFTSGNLYAVSSMVDGTASGYIASVSSSYQFLDVELIDKGTHDDSYLDQYIKGTYSVTAKNSPAQAATNLTLSSLSSTMSQLSTILADNLASPPSAGKPSIAGTATRSMYADAGNTVTDAGGTAYVAPDSPLWKGFLMPYTAALRTMTAFMTPMSWVSPWAQAVR